MLPETSPRRRTLAITIDTTAPDPILVAPDLLSEYDSGISDSDNITNSTTLGFDITSPGDPYYRVYVNDTLFSSQYEIDPQFVLNWLADDDARVSVASVDVAGNVSYPSPSLDVTIDRYGPAAPVINATSGNPPTLLLPVNSAYAPVYTWDWPSSGPLVIAERDSTSGAALRNYEIPFQIWNVNGYSMAQDSSFIYIFGMGYEGFSPAGIARIDLLTGAFAGRRDVTGLPDGYTMQGLAMLNGRLYTASGAGDILCEIDPLSGEVLHTIATLFRWTAGRDQLRQRTLRHADRGTLIAAAYDGTLAEIDPATGQITAFHPVIDPSISVTWNAYAGNGVAFLGLYPGTGAYGWDRAAVDIDTGEVLWRTPDDAVSWPAGYAGDGILVSPPRTYHRVFCDGVQVSDDYLTAPSFTLPLLSDGSHTLILQAVDEAGNVTSEPLEITIAPRRPRQR